MIVVIRKRGELYAVINRRTGETLLLAKSKEEALAFKITLDAMPENDMNSGNTYQQ